MRVEENLHIEFLKNKPIVAGAGPQWLFDIDMLTESMNYVSIIAGTNFNDFVGTEEHIGQGHSSKEIRSSQDYILMPLWKDGSLFDSSSENATNDEPQSSYDAGNKDGNDVNKDSGIDTHEKSANSINDVNTVRPSINTASSNFDTGILNINTDSTTVSTASPEATYTNFLGDKPEAEMSNINTTYQVPSTPHTRIHKDHSLDLVIGDMDVKSAFLYERIKEEVYVCQPSWFEDPDHPDKVYKMVKALYGLHQAPRACHDKYVTEVLRNFNLLNVKSASTSVETEKPLVKDADGVDVDVHLYRSMIRSLMYLTASRPDIMYVVCVKTVNEDVRLQALVDGKKVIVNEASILRDLRFDDAEGIFVNPSLTKKVFANMKRVRTCFSGAITPLFKTMMVQAPEAVGDIPTDTQDTLILTQPSSSQPQRKHKSRRKLRKETEVPHTEPQTEESVPTPSNDPLLSGKDRMQLTELTNLCTNLQKQVLDLEKAKTAQAKEIVNLKKKVQEAREKEKVKDFRLKKDYTRLTAQDQRRMNEEDLFGVNDLDGDEVTRDVTTSENVEQDAIVAEKKTLIEIKAAKLKARWVIVQEPSEFRTTSSLQPSQLPQAKDKGKGIMVESEKPLKKKDQIALDEEEVKLKRENNYLLKKDLNFWLSSLNLEEKIVEESLKKTQAEVTEGSSKRAGDEIEKASAKRQRLQKEDDTVELKRCLEIVLEDDDDVTIKETPLSSTSPTMVDYKIYKEGKKSYFRIIKADGNSQNYLTFGKMFKNFNR
nr:hypothetical protein [Tanacetum cinerariifolium]